MFKWVSHFHWCGETASSSRSCSVSVWWNSVWLHWSKSSAGTQPSLTASLWVVCEATAAPSLLCCCRRRLPVLQGTDTPISMRSLSPTSVASVSEGRLERPAVMNRTPMSTDRLNSVASTTARAIRRSSLATPLLLSDDARLSPLPLPLPFLTLAVADEIVVGTRSFLPWCLKRGKNHWQNKQMRLGNNMKE